MFAVPPLVDEMVRRGWLGAKSGQGFYKKTDAGDILTLDPATMEYRPNQPARLLSLEAARGIEDVGERVRKLIAGQDKVGRFLRDTLVQTLDYAERIAPVVAHAPADVDRAMRWGFGWELGPFELRGASTRAPSLLGAARSRGVVRRNAGASLVDIGDGVLCVEFHSKMNAIGGDTIEMLQAAVREAAASYAALVVANDAVNFSAGANLLLLLLEAQEGNWDDVDLMVRAFQGATMALKHADVPVVVAPAGLALGGGCEIALHGTRVQAAAETYMGLVEVGVGLIPAGGGTKEMLARAMETAPPGADPMPFVQRVFETLGFGKTSTSGPDGRRLGYLRDGDGISMNRDHLIGDAKASALAGVQEHVPAQPRRAIRVGGESVLAALKLGVHLAWRSGRITDHDAVIGRKLAWVLAGGNVTHATTLSEGEMLDLEREAFLSLCGERKTQERIAHTLKTGKLLRN
jgi:3-hydroxyacyl-CoA dehydrogenase